MATKTKEPHVRKLDDVPLRKRLSKKLFLEKLEKVKRKGISNLIDYLENSDFFVAPASIKAHGNRVGGLCAHSMLVHKFLVQKVSKFDISKESATIVGLLHDLCKIDVFVEDINPPSDAMVSFLKRLADEQNFKLTKPMLDNYWNCKKMIDFLKDKQEGTPPSIAEKTWVINDNFPFGHGEKSVYILQKYIELTDEEALSIRYHLGAFEPSVNMGYPIGYSFRDAVNMYPLVYLTIASDLEAIAYERYLTNVGKF